MAAVAPVILTLRTWPRGDRYCFDTAEYDETADRLRLTYGPVTAACAHPTPEGHVVRTAAPDGYLCGLVITNVSERLHEDGKIEVTLGPTELVELDLSDIASLVSRPGVRRSRRFARRSRDAHYL